MADASGQNEADEQDASMDTILASIRRIILEDEAGASPAQDMHRQEHGHAEDADDDDLLVLQSSMIVDADGARSAQMAEPANRPHPGTQSAAELAAALFDEPVALPAAPPAAVAPLVAQPAVEPVVDPVPHGPAAEEPLLAPAASLAATQALASLQDALRPEPAPSAPLRLLRTGGPTIEDMVRDELRLQLKDWLDSNLPPLVERLVAQEIGRLVGRG